MLSAWGRLELRSLVGGGQNTSTTVAEGSSLITLAHWIKVKTHTIQRRAWIQVRP